MSHLIGVLKFERGSNLEKGTPQFRTSLICLRQPIHRALTALRDSSQLLSCSRKANEKGTYFLGGITRRALVAPMDEALQALMGPGLRRARPQWASGLAWAGQWARP